MTYKRITDENDLNIAFAMRKEIFVEEQQGPLDAEFDEFDNLDGKAEHILVYYDQEPAGTGRVRTVEDTAKLERICLRPSFRDKGLGKVVVSSLETIAKEKGLSKAKLHAQKYAEGFYQKLGYTTVSDTFIEDNIPHVLMIKNL